MPPYDVSLLKRVQPPAKVGDQHVLGPTVTVTVRIADVHGHTIPVVPNLTYVKDTRDMLLYDPRAQGIRIADRPAYSGMTYSLVGSGIPTGKQLTAVGDPGKDLRPFLEAPDPPNAVLALLSRYAEAASKQGLQVNSFDRLEFLRTALYSHVVAAGAGKPVDMPPSRVVDILNGGEASPYEITAAEALLARWSGVPARIAYGYWNGDKQADGSYQVHPRDAATYLEAYFKGYGWVPFLGEPAKAKASTSDQEKKQVAALRANLSLITYVIVRDNSPLALYEYVRWYLVRVAPVALALAALYFTFPGFMKLLRTRRRRQWARQTGLGARIAVTYAEFRDAARDLAIGEPAATPVEFLDHLVPDSTHTELAWLVTRALWGDLRRDLTEDDTRDAELMARSVRRRMRAAQSELKQLLAFCSRNSLREPYSLAMPNLWLSRTPGPRQAADVARSAGVQAAAAILAVVFTVTASACASAPAAKRNLPTGLVPEQLGQIHFQREPAAEKAFTQSSKDALVSGGLVYTVGHDDYIEGSVQIQLFKPEVDTSDIASTEITDQCVVTPESCPGHEIFKSIQSSLGSGHFHRLYYKGRKAYEMLLPDLTFFLWFPPNTQTVAILALRREFGNSSSQALLKALLDYEAGRAPAPVPISSPAPAATPSSTPLEPTPSTAGTPQS